MIEIRPVAAVRGSAVLATLAMVLAACSSMPPNALRGSKPGVLQQEFLQLHGPAKSEDYSSCESPYENETGVTEIAIERTSCYGFCPTYTLRLFSDGRVEYVGQASVKTVGTRRGKLDVYLFTTLARTAVGIGFFDMRDRYACGVSDDATVYVAVTKSGQRKVIEHYAPDWNGPHALRLLEEAIDAVQAYVDWQ